MDKCLVSPLFVQQLARAAPSAPSPGSAAVSHTVGKKRDSKARVEDLLSSCERSCKSYAVRTKFNGASPEQGKSSITVSRIPTTSIPCSLLVFRRLVDHTLLHVLRHLRLSLFPFLLFHQLLVLFLRFFVFKALAFGSLLAVAFSTSLARAD